MTHLPFTPDQFFEIFAIYNGRFSIVVAAWWLVTLVIVIAAWSKPARYSRLLTLVLAVLWAWNAVAYHALLFTRINPAAWLFAALFVVEAVLVGSAARRSHDYFGSHGTKSRIGLGLVAYSFVYPFLSTLNHAYPATPTFGVPCPTAMLTIGLLLTVRGDVPAALAIVPAVWAMIGGSAAWLLNVPTDVVLLAAGLLLMAILVAEWMARRTRRARAAARRPGAALDGFRTN
jgi:uncharacterized protein DUF6064